MADSPHHELAALALALAGDKPCPMCNAVEGWKPVADPAELRFTDRVNPTPAVVVGCTKCGYAHVFLAAQLNEYAANLTYEDH